MAGKYSNKKFMISHASADKDAVECFRDYIIKAGLEFKADDIFCSSIDGSKIESGDNFLDAIIECLESCEVCILFITENFKDSEICLNEMGAAWGKDCIVIPMKWGDLKFKDVGALHVHNITELVDDEDCLENLVKTLRKAGVVKEFDNAEWNKQKRKFLRKIKKIEPTSPDNKKLSKNEWKKIEEKLEKKDRDIEELGEEIEGLEEKIEQLKELKDAEEVTELEKERGDLTEADEFEEIIDKLKDELGTFHSKVAEIILREHYESPSLGQDEIRYYQDEIDNAIARKYLCYSDGLEATDKDPIPEILDLLGELENFSELDEPTFEEWYREKFEMSYDPSDKDFWEKHYGL